MKAEKYDLNFFILFLPGELADKIRIYAHLCSQPHIHNHTKAAETFDIYFEHTGNIRHNVTINRIISMQLHDKT